MDSINYIEILVVILVLYLLYKCVNHLFGKLAKKGEEFLNLEDEMGIYHNNVGSHMRTVGHENLADSIKYNTLIHVRKNSRDYAINENDIPTLTINGLRLGTIDEMNYIATTLDQTWCSCMWCRNTDGSIVNAYPSKPGETTPGCGVSGSGNVHICGRPSAAPTTPPTPGTSTTQPVIDHNAGADIFLVKENARLTQREAQRLIVGGYGIEHIAYKTIETPTTTHNLNETTGLIDGEHFKLEKVDAPTIPYYQLAFEEPTTVYGLYMKAGYFDSFNQDKAMTFDIKYSTGSTNKEAFIPLLDDNNSKKNIVLSRNSGFSDNQTIREEKEFPVPIMAKYIRIYNTNFGPIDFTVDAIVKPLTYVSLRMYNVKKVNSKQAQTDGTHIDKKVDIAETSHYVSHINDTTPLKPYSDKMGRREIFKLDVRTPHFVFDNLDLRSKPTFDAYIIRSARGTDGEFCHLNTENKQLYCDKTKSNPSVLLRFHMTVSDHDDGKTMVVQHFKSGMYADKEFKFTVRNASEAQKFVVDKHTTADIKKIVNLDDYIDKKEEMADKGFKDCQNEEFVYVNIRRPYNDATLAREHQEAMVNRAGKLPKLIKFKANVTDAELPTFEGIYIKTDTENKQIRFKISSGTTSTDADSRYSYLEYDGSGTFDKQQYGALCTGIVNGTTESTTEIPQYVYDKVEITDSVSEWISHDTEKYKPELYEGRKVENDGVIKYVTDIKKHTPTSVKNFTPDIIKVCLPITALNSDRSGVDGNSLKIKTNLFNVVDETGKTLELEFTVSDNNLITGEKCSNASIVNNMFKIYKKPGAIHYEIAKPNDPEYKKIDCNCNCLGDSKHVKEYRKTNNFVKSILDNVIVKTDNIMSQRNQELTEIRTAEETLFNQPEIQDYNNYESANLLDTNPHRRMDEVQNYYAQAGTEGFSDMPKLPIDLETLKQEFIGMYKPFDSQFLLLDGVTLQLDNDHIGFIKNNTPIYKLRHNQIMPFFSPYGNFDGIKVRLVNKDKMVHTIENRNFEKLLEYIGLTPPNFIYISRHHHKDEDSRTIRTTYKISNRQHTTLLQMEKV